MIDFDRDTHTYTDKGVRLPSVTEVLGVLESFAHIPPEALERARDRGTCVHEAMALLARDQLNWDSLDDELLPYVRAGQRFFVETGATVIASEVLVGSPRLKCAGTVDLIAKFRNHHGLFDFKATAVVPPSVGPQTAGYALLGRDEFKPPRGKQLLRFCVHLKRDDYRLIALEDSRDECIFTSALNLYHWGRRHAAAA